MGNIIFIIMGTIKKNKKSCALIKILEHALKFY
jgi:hypothetical protein